MSRLSQADFDRVLGEFRKRLDSAQLAEGLGVTPDEARTLWLAARRTLTRRTMSKESALEFAAETDEMLSGLERLVLPYLHTYNGGSERLTGLASLLKQIAELRRTRISLRQDIGLIPSVTRQRAPSAPPALSPAQKKAAEEAAAAAAAATVAPPPPALTVDELRAHIRTLQAELERVQEGAIPAVAGGNGASVSSH